jgi:hypothetical protein
MRCLVVFMAAVMLGACPSKQPAGPQMAGAGCPSGDGVFVASYVTQEPGKGRSGWVVPLHAAELEAGAQAADYASIDGATASSAGVPAPPTGTLWLATATGQPCRATMGGYYAARVDGPAPSVSYGVELDGCAAPPNPDEAGGIVLATAEPPTGCRFEVPQPVAARLGEMTANKQWQRPTKETPIPQALAAAIPQKPCAAPSCEMLWAFGEVKVNGQTVAWSGAVNWQTVGDLAQACAWPAERFSGFFVPGPQGAVKVSEGQDHPLVLSAVLADGSGARVLLAEGPGVYATYDLAGTQPRLARKVTWMVAPADAWDAIDHIGPLCEPDETRPPPPPASAAPQSPY